MNDDDFRDPELDDLLAPLASARPSELHVARWKRALRVARPAARAWAPVAAALFVGFVLGGLTFGLGARQPDSGNEEFATAHATEEIIFAKAE